MPNHHLQLKVQCDFTYATKGFFNCKVNCNCFLITNCNRKFVTNPGQLELKSN
jgi:hypothetical protein